MRIAVIGAGISGLAAAYYLRRGHAVEVFEREPRAGGHAHTVQIGGVPVDTGFIVYNETTYPGFSGFLRELGVDTAPTEMSFGVRCDRHGIEWSSRGLRGFLANPRNAMRPGHWAMLRDMRRFYRDASAILAGEATDVSLGAYLAAGGFGDGFARHYLRPLAASVWSTPPGEIDAMPLMFFVRFLANHGMIGWGRRLQWRTVRGGSRQYVAALCRLLGGSLRVSAPIEEVRRESDGVRVIPSRGDAERFDAVVFACHADDALRLLADADCEEREALSGFRYAANRVVLHRDTSVLPRRQWAQAAWNYVTADCGAPAAALTLTYDLARLQNLPRSGGYCVSVNPGSGIARESVVRELAYRHPIYSAATLQAQTRLRALSGERSTYFAGAHLGAGFHEDGYQSGLRVARQLGAVP